MRKSFQLPGQYLPWLVLLFFVDAFAALLLWILNTEAFSSVALAFLLFTALLFFCVCFVLIRVDRKKEEAFLLFLERPDENRQEELLRLLSSPQSRSILALGELLREKEAAFAELSARIEDYEEYVESWAHEIKTPLSLLTFLLDNRREELPEEVNVKLDYIRSRMQESVDQMLFYARLKGTKKDYLFEQIGILSCIEETLADYKPLLEEKGFSVQCGLSEEMVCTDRRGLRFGVRSCDLPYIFDKGFTGDSGKNRKKATGMGLYLAQGIARDLKLSLEAKSHWGDGFEISVKFPI